MSRVLVPGVLAGIRNTQLRDVSGVADQLLATTGAWRTNPVRMGMVSIEL